MTDDEKIKQEVAGLSGRCRRAPRTGYTVPRPVVTAFIVLAEVIDAVLAKDYRLTSAIEAANDAIRYPQEISEIWEKVFDGLTKAYDALAAIRRSQ